MTSPDVQAVIDVSEADRRRHIVTDAVACLLTP